MNSWTLTDLEFKVLCDTRFFGVVPASFRITSRIRLLDDYQREWKRTRADLERRNDSAFEAIVDTMVLPEVLVGGEAWQDADFDNPKKRIRFYAGRSGSRGFLTIQHPGETLNHAEGFTITPCDPRALGEVVAGLLPPAQPGRRGPIAIDTDPGHGHRSSGTGSMISDDDDDEFSSASFFDLPASLTGTIRLVQGRSKFGPRGRISIGRLFRDLPGDGRYVMSTDDKEPVAIGMGSAGLADWIDAQAEHVLERMNDFQEVDE